MGSSKQNISFYFTNPIRQEDKSEADNEAVEMKDRIPNSKVKREKAGTPNQATFLDQAKIRIINQIGSEGG